MDCIPCYRTRLPVDKVPGCANSVIKFQYKHHGVILASHRGLNRSGIDRKFPQSVQRQSRLCRLDALGNEGIEIFSQRDDIVEDDDSRSSCEEPPVSEEACTSNQHIEQDRNSVERFFIFLKGQYSTKNAPMAPWGVDTILTVLILWVICFWISAYSLVPRLLSLVKSAGLVGNLSYSGEAALRHLLLDFSQILSIYILLSRSLREYRPRLREYFAVSLTSAKSWSMVGLGFLAFPAIDLLHRSMVTLISRRDLHGLSSGAKMFEGDGFWVRFLWFFVLGVVAPIWEEVMFRGFLLPSLSRILSPTKGIILTSLLFSLVHFTKEGFLPLMILGAIFGFSYCATRNLFPAMMLHGLWNMCLLAQVLTQ
jgi:membrane protease YdiL (CAAX protease family)